MQRQRSSRGSAAAAQLSMLYIRNVVGNGTLRSDVIQGGAKREPKGPAWKWNMCVCVCLCAIQWNIKETKHKAHETQERVRGGDWKRATRTLRERIDKRIPMHDTSRVCVCVYIRIQITAHTHIQKEAVAVGSAVCRRRRRCRWLPKSLANCCWP